jgi:hypothetical protein
VRHGLIEAETDSTEDPGVVEFVTGRLALRIARVQDFRLIAEVKTTGATQFLPYFFGLKVSAPLRSGEGLRGLHVIVEGWRGFAASASASGSPSWTRSP